MRNIEIKRRTGEVSWLLLRCAQLMLTYTIKMNEIMVLRSLPPSRTTMLRKPIELGIKLVVDCEYLGLRCSKKAGLTVNVTNWHWSTLCVRSRSFTRRVLSCGSLLVFSPRICNLQHHGIKEILWQCWIEWELHDWGYLLANTVPVKNLTIYLSRNES
jgi:hypothetical protein